MLDVLLAILTWKRKSKHSLQLSWSKVQSWTLFKVYNSELPLVQEPQPVASTGEKSPPHAQIRETAARQERTTRASYILYAEFSDCDDRL